MLMNILLINGSPRPHGNTSEILELCKVLLDGTLKNTDISFHIISLAKLDVKPCKGCRICFNHSEHKCPHKDDLLDIKRLMDEADAIIIGSPVYVEDVSGLTKNLLDRMAFNCHRPFLLGKPIYLFTTSGAGASKHALKTLRHAFLSWGGIIVGEHTFSMGPKMDYDLAYDRFSSVLTPKMNVMNKHMQASTPSVFSLIAFRIQQKYWRTQEDKTSADYTYWFEKGWLDEDCHYYTKVHLSLYKRILSFLISQLVSLILLK